MTDITIDAGTLTASREDRIVTGLLLPYGEKCRSNLGTFSVSPGAFTIPADVPNTIGFNVEHRREASVGRGVTMIETPAGIVATFSIARTPEGDQVLDEIAAGTRRHLSVEASRIKIKNGKAVAGLIFGGAVTSAPAFPSATLLASAPDTEPENDQPEVAVTVNDSRPTVRVGEPAPGTNPPHTDEPDAEPDEDTDEDTDEPEDPDEDDTEQESENDVPTTATAPNNLHAARAAAPRRNTLDLTTFTTLLAGARRHRGDRDFMGRLGDAEDAGATLFAAITDITVGDGNGDVQAPGAAGMLPQYIGELWSQVAYQRRYVPLMLNGPLTALKLYGWRWKTPPAVAPWAGDKTAVPSPPVETEGYETTAQRLAGVYDVGREFRDFDVPGFWNSFWNAMTASYARQSDDKALKDAVAGATAVEGTDGDLVSSVAAGLVAVSAYGTPAYAVADTALFVNALSVTAQAAPAYLPAGPLSFPIYGPSITIAGIPVVPGNVGAGKVLVGAREAATFRELPGSPIRVEGVFDMARGGEDPGLFGYCATEIHQPLALALVSPSVARASSSKTAAK